MTHLLHLDASARPGRRGIDPHGSHTRALSHRFIARWRAARPHDPVRYRDLGAAPPRLVDHDWIRAEFTPRNRREPWMIERLAESDAMVDEVIGSDLLVIGAPLYNFGMPAPLTAWIDAIVRIGRTVVFDPSREDDPYVPLLADRGRRILRVHLGKDVSAGLAKLRGLVQKAYIQISRAADTKVSVISAPT
mgnify:CR=1 FL=1